MAFFGGNFFGGGFFGDGAASSPPVSWLNWFPKSLKKERRGKKAAVREAIAGLVSSEMPEKASEMLAMAVSRYMPGEAELKEMESELEVALAVEMAWERLLANELMVAEILAIWREIQIEMEDEEILLMIS